MTWKKHFLYNILVSDLGEIQTLDRVIEVKLKNGNVYNKSIPGKIKSPVDNGTGYFQIGLGENAKCKRLYVHRLVWETYNGEIPTGYEIDHINSVKSDNRLVNLRLVTRIENMDKMILENPHVLKNLIGS